jgi:hypothetical protein
MVKKVRKIEKIIKKDRKTKLDVDFDIPMNTKLKLSFSRTLYLRNKRNTFIAIILRKNKSAVLCRIPMSVKEFSIDGNTYFSVQSGAYICPKQTILSIYLEGCVLPLEHSYIQYEKYNVLLKDKLGNLVKEITPDIPSTIINDLPTDAKGTFLKTSDGFIIKKILEKIKGLEFDSITANAIYNSGLIEKVAKTKAMQKLITFLFILSVISLILIVGNMIISYVRI